MGLFILRISLDVYHYKYDTIKTMLPKRDWATFNIRKLQRKGQLKQPEELGLFTPDYQFEKSIEPQTYTNPKRQKQLMIDYSVNQAVLNSKAYNDLKQIYNQSKYRSAQKKKQLQESVQQLKKQKEQALEEQQKLSHEMVKYEELLHGLKQKIMETRGKNKQMRDMIQYRMSSEAEYISNMLISMRFQAEYDHDIDPDQMTYEELLELEEKIGSVCKGLPIEVIAKLPCKQIHQTLEDQCTVCFSPMEKGEIMLQLPCEHKFHQDCLKEWLAKQKICPLCKGEVLPP